MFDHRLCYQEVIPDQVAPVIWRDIDLNTGGTQSTLQDIKIPEKANGYCYKDTSTHVTRNRFIYWRLNNDVLELVEESLDVNLTGNRLRYRFRETPILDGITIHETQSNVVILVPTISSVHRLMFTHPNCQHINTEPELSLESIFADVPIAANIQSYVYIPPTSIHSQLPHAAASSLNQDEIAIFLFAYVSGELLLVKQHANEHAESIELQAETIMPKFLSGMFRNKSSENIVISMLLHTSGLETYAITLCRDGQIKVWSCSTLQCIAISDVLIADVPNAQSASIKNTQCQLLKQVEDDFLFAVYLNTERDKCFCLLRPIINGTQFSLVKHKKFNALHGDLIDYAITSTQICTIWRSIDGESTLFSGVYNSNATSVNFEWLPVILEPLPNPHELHCDDGIDPRQLYLDYIFAPGRFPLQIISKALSIYKRSLLIPDISLSVNVLKQRVCAAVEAEIQGKITESEVNDEVYMMEAIRCWSTFYSCCVQYHATTLKPLGIMLLPPLCGGILLKKASYSILRPMDIVEHLVLCPETHRTCTLLDNNQISHSNEEIQDLVQLTEVLDLIDQHLCDFHRDAIENHLHLIHPPTETIKDVVQDLLTEEFLVDFIQSIQNISDLYLTVHKLMELLRMDEATTDEELNNSMESTVAHLFSSALGVSVISQSFKQQISTKFTLCRNLVIFKALLLEEYEGKVANFESLRSVCKLDVEILLNSYHSLWWLCRQTADNILNLDTQNQRLSSLKMSPIFHLRTNLQQSVSLIELYLSSNGGIDGHKDLRHVHFDKEALAAWPTSMLTYLNRLTLLIWPLSGNHNLLEWLLLSGQHVHLQQYANLLYSWCCYGEFNHLFYAGISYLCTGEVHKAYLHFSNLFKEFSADEFVVRRITGQSPEQSFILFNVKIIQLLEVHGASDYAIKASMDALKRINDEEPLKPTFHSIIFKHHLALHHYDDAFHALCANPDAERKKDNLRDLVKTLLDAKQVATLMSFDYDDLEESFLSILYTRARGIDTIENIYYDFLYAFATRKNMWRFCASVAYEHAFRLSFHASVEALVKRVQCTLMAVNTLSLVDAPNAWVLKPAEPDLNDEEHVMPTEIGSKTNPTIIHLHKEVDIIDLLEIRKELVFIQARLQLCVIEPKSITHLLHTPPELVMYLSAAGLFRNAFNVCEMFELDYDVIFERIAFKCYELSQREQPDAWNWLLENDIHDFDYIPNSTCKMIWLLLQHYLDHYEEPKMTRYHRIVSERLLQLGDYPPLWLIASYKKRNPGELLRVLHINGYLREAANLALEYVSAALGYGPEHFGFAQPLTQVAQAMSFNLPLQAISALIYELKLQNDDAEPPLQQEHHLLQEVFKKYLETSVRISNDVCREKFSAMVL